MPRFAPVAVLSLMLALPLVAQSPQGQAAPAGPGMGRFQPPPDHWMTIDSLSQALGLSADQRTKITPAHTALNGVMKDAAARRQAIRQQMQASGFTPGQSLHPRSAPNSTVCARKWKGFRLRRINGTPPSAII